MLRRLLALIFLVAGCAAAPPPAPVSGRLPPVELTALDARRMPVASVVSGKPALLSFWATWCTACEQEFDALNRADASARQRGAVVVGIAVGEDREKVAAFVHRRGLAYAQLVDEDFRLSDAMGQRKVPATVVLDKTGKVVFTGGALDAEALASFRRTMAAE